MSFRDDVDALAARHAALEREVADSARVLDEARALQQRRSLPVLDNIRIATPCSASWDRMLGDDRMRRCNDCNKSVFNLSTMTRDQAETLIVAKNGDLCARYYQRADGTILLSDCTVGVSQRNKRRLVAAGALALLAGTSAVAMMQSQSRPSRNDDYLRDMMRQSYTAPQVDPLPPPHPAPLMGVVAFPTPPVARPTMGHLSVPALKK
jgi:hypothetical protein